MFDDCLKRMESVASYLLGTVMCINDSEELLLTSGGFGYSLCCLQL